MKINYVIATWAGQDTKRTRIKITNPSPQNHLISHLTHLAKLKHNLAQITVMKPKCPPNKAYPNYYNYQHLQFPCPIIDIECKNFGYSNGQWMTCYEKTKGGEFDYYICVEDDYCPAIDNFDKCLADIYKSKFSNDIGKLCGFIEGFPHNKGHPLPAHYESVAFISSKTFDKLYAFPRWKRNPKAWLDRIILDIPAMQKLKSKPRTIGGFYQVNFSLLFTQSSIPFDDIPDWDWLYYNDTKNVLWYLISGKCAAECKIPENLPKLNENKKILFQPIQMIAHHKMARFDSKKVCVLVIGNHRSGTSALSGCLNMCGLDVGKNKDPGRNKFNEKGFFENLSILHFNDKVLKAIGSSWKDAKPFNATQEKQMMTFVDELADIITREYTTDRFLIKDPRIIFLYPLYLAALNKLKIYIKIIYSHREFSEIVKSLKRAQRLEPSHALKLCQKHLERGREMMDKVQSFTVHYQELLEDPVALLDKIDRYLEVVDLASQINIEKIKEFIDPKLKHF